MSCNPLKGPGCFQGVISIEETNPNGTISYNQQDEKYIISREPITNDADGTTFGWQQVESDFNIYGNFDNEGVEIAPNCNVGLMVRQNLTTGSPFISVYLQANKLLSVRYRMEQDAPTFNKELDGCKYHILQIEREGELITVSACEAGSNINIIDRIPTAWAKQNLYVGAFLHTSKASLETNFTINSIRITIPAPATLTPYKDFLGSRIEVLDITTCKRRIIFETEGNLEAPNWHPNGYLILNGKGKLYRLQLDGMPLELIDSDFANSNNNDHGISPNGELLAISHHVADRPHGESSVIYTMPVGGGKPKQVTPNSPSYWHGWSPDGESIIYTGMRNSQYDIYRISVHGGEETQLTNSQSLDDGSDYSACGKYIWFNSNRNGSMDIWRMRSDGSDQSQITNDNFQNWFPHESPDGQWVIFLSYPPEVDPWDHPYYKHVTLRLMSTTDLKPRVIAHLYGGQGTINVPSWSPDSKYVAFVSNSYGFFI